MPFIEDYAFPFEHHQKFSINNPTIASQGLSKREYIASLVLQGLLSNPQIDLSQLAETGLGLTQNAVYLADQLLVLTSSTREPDAEPTPEATESVSH